MVREGGRSIKKYQWFPTTEREQPLILSIASEFRVCLLFVLLLAAADPPWRPFVHDFSIFRRIFFVGTFNYLYVIPTTRRLLCLLKANSRIIWSYLDFYTRKFRAILCSSVYEDCVYAAVTGRVHRTDRVSWICAYTRHFDCERDNGVRQSVRENWGAKNW